MMRRAGDPAKFQTLSTNIPTCLLHQIFPLKPFCQATFQTSISIDRIATPTGSSWTRLTLGSFDEKALDMTLCFLWDSLSEHYTFPPDRTLAVGGNLRAFPDVDEARFYAPLINVSFSWMITLLAPLFQCR